MFTSTTDFEKTWAYEGEATQKIMNALTDASLKTRVANDHRTLGAVAWHIVTSISEMINRTGLNILEPHHDAPTPATAAAIAKAYARASEALVEQVTGAWGDSDLLSEDDMYGEKWKKGMTLRVLINHQIHHRGQMTILMRAAGLTVPGVYGPSREEWTAMGIPLPAVD